MGRPPNADARATWRAIRKAGIRLLFDHGFESMSLRQLAAESGLKTGSLYNYFESKSQFLALVLCGIIETILADFRKIVDPIEDPLERLRTFVRFHIGWHTVRRAETFIGFMEMRNLSQEDYRRYTALRKQYEDYVTDILARGVKAGVFSVADPRVTTFALLSMLTGTANWYRRSGRLSQEELVRLHTDLVIDMLGANAAGREREARSGGAPASARD